MQNGGVYKEEIVEKKEFEAAVVPLSTSELKYEENGHYSKQDRKMYCYENFKPGEKIEYKSFVYTIDKEKDYSDFDENLKIYYLVRSDNS